MIEFPFVTKPSIRYGTLYIPIAKISVQTTQGFEAVSFLIDSGADLTVISYDLGRRAGWTISEEDTILQLAGITGESSFVEREIGMIIGAHRFRCRVAWAQDPNVTDVLGRLNIFDFFNIEFQQSKRRTLFRAARRNKRR